ncbi:MAG: GntR family transcriptional regulator [Muribaculum sp.]|nr:GntR family transcriptional regulator [Muribaculum sp.]
MNFKENNKAIYLQIADKICDDILLGTYTPGGRLPSVREYAAMVQVNANTVMRSYEHLSSLGVIFNKRGIGFFVSEDAIENVTRMRRTYFLESEITEIFHQLRLLGVSADELKDMYKKYCENNN